MPGMDSNAGLAFGTMASRLAENYAKKKQQEFAQEQQRTQLVTSLVSKGLESGTIKNPQEAFQFMLEQFGAKGVKGKGGKSGSLPPVLQTIIGGIHKAGQQGQSTDQGSTGAPQFMSPDEMSAAALKQKQGESDIAERARTREIEAQGKQRLSEIEEQNKGRRGVADKQPSQNADGAWTIKVRDAEGNVVYEQPAQQPKDPNRPTGTLGQFYDAAIASGVPKERAAAVATRNWEKDRSQKLQQATARTNAYLAASRVSLLRNQEAYDEMKQVAPYRLATIMANADAAEDRAAITDYKAATVGTPDPQKIKTSAERIVAAATKQATTLAGKENSILKGLGFDDDEATIRRNLIAEMSGGQDPDTVEKHARGEGLPPAPPKSRARKKRDAVKYLQDHKLPVTDANVQHFLSGGQ